jgi:hypothetical protein
VKLKLAWVVLAEDVELSPMCVQANKPLLYRALQPGARLPQLQVKCLGDVPLRSRLLENGLDQRPNDHKCVVRDLLAVPRWMVSAASMLEWQAIQGSVGAQKTRRPVCLKQAAHVYVTDDALRQAERAREPQLVAGGA